MKHNKSFRSIFQLSLSLFLFFWFAHITMYAQTSSSDHLPVIQLKINKIQDSLKATSEPEKLLKMRNNLADCYITQGSYYHALENLKQNIAISEESKRNYAYTIAETHLLFCKTYDRLLHIEPILNHIKQYDYYISIAYPSKQIYKANYYMYLSRYYNLQLLIDKAFANSLKSIEIIESNPADKHLVSLYLIYSSHLFSLRNSSESYQKKSKFRDKTHALLAKEFKEYSSEKSGYNISINMFEYDSALNYIHNRTEDLETKIYSPQFLKVNQLLDKEIERVTGYLGYYNPYTARFNSLKGLLYFTYNDYDSAIHYFDIAIKQITGGKQDAKGIWNTSNQVLIPTYIWKSKCIDRRYRQYQHIELLYENEQILAKAAEAWKIYIADRMEYNSLFNSNIYTPNPYPFIQKNYIELFLKTQKQFYKSQIFEAGSLAKHYSLVLKLNKNIKHKKYENNEYNYLLYEKYIQNLNYPHQKPNNTTPPKPFTPLRLTNKFETIQSNLKFNEAVISYSIIKIKNKEYVYAQLIENKKDTLLQLPFNLNISEKENERENTIIESIKNNDIESFKRESYFIYQQLFEPIANILSPQINSVLLYQDPVIENLNIPFELLISKKTTINNFKKIEYINNQYSISYPITTYNAKVEKSLTTPQEIVIFIADNDSLNSLMYATKFAKNISKKFNTKIISGYQGTKDNFRKTIQTASILILVSHGNGNRSEDGTKKGLFLTDSFLSLTEINQLSSNCELLVLAGCSTGKGYRSLEGNISLAHAFAYAGVKSTIISDWDIDEKPSLMILEYWLEYLSQGYSKSEALSMAQKQFLSNASNRLSNPIYWNAFRITGLNNPIVIQTKPNKSNWIIYIGVILSICFLCLYIYRLYKRLNYHN